MPVHGVVGYVDLAAGEPLVVGLVGVVENLSIRLVPITKVWAISSQKST